MELSPEEKRNLLKEEYFFIQQQYQSFDEKTLQIKGWISTGAIAGIALAFGKDIGNYALLILLFIVVLCCVFWYLEAYWKLFQYAFRDRIRIIEAYFRGDQNILFKNPDPLQIYHSWFLSYVKDEPIYEYEKTANNGERPATRLRRLIHAAMQRSVFTPYLVIIILCILSASTLLLHR